MRTGRRVSHGKRFGATGPCRYNGAVVFGIALLCASGLHVSIAPDVPPSVVARPAFPINSHLRARNPAAYGQPFGPRGIALQLDALRPLRETAVHLVQLAASAATGLWRWSYWRRGQDSNLKRTALEAGMLPITLPGLLWQRKQVSNLRQPVSKTGALPTELFRNNS